MRQVFYMMCLAFLFFGCSNSDDDGGSILDPDVEGQNPNDETIDATIAVKLVFPYEDSLCNEGINLSETESTVFFEWEANDAADGYTLIIENLSTAETITTNTTEIKIATVIKRSTPYSWYVVSNSNDALIEDEKSETWQFYNAAPGVEFYAPFPAAINAPAMAASIPTATNVTLNWTGSDVDNDIASYDVYFGTNSSPALNTSDVMATELNVSVLADTIYYWKVITKDEAGNSSDSGVYQFKVQ
ncbi:MAG: hypothetical protein ABJK28_12555 [Algibacter sp.]